MQSRINFVVLVDYHDTLIYERIKKHGDSIFIDKRL